MVTEIADATGTAYEVAPEQAGKVLKVRVTFTDDKGTEETLVSAATEAVVDRRPVAATLSVGDGAAEAGRFRVRVAFGDAVTGLAAADFTAARVAGDAAAVLNLAETETDRVWTAWVAAAEAGRYTVRLAAGAAQSGERRSLASALAVDVDAAGQCDGGGGPGGDVGVGVAGDGVARDVDGRRDGGDVAHVLGAGDGGDRQRHAVGRDRARRDGAPGGPMRAARAGWRCSPTR